VITFLDANYAERDYVVIPVNRVQDNPFCPADFSSPPPNPERKIGFGRTTFMPSVRISSKKVVCILSCAAEDGLNVSGTWKATFRVTVHWRAKPNFMPLNA